MGVRQGGWGDACRGSTRPVCGDQVGWTCRARTQTPAHDPPITAHQSPSHGASVGRSAGWGGGAETQLVRLLSHRHLNGLGLERGQVRSEGLEV